MKYTKKNVFLATVLAFAVSSSSCQMLGGLLGGGGGGGGIMDMLGGLLGGGGGPALTEAPDSQDSLSLAAPRAYVKNGYRIVSGSLPEPSKQEGSLYGAFEN